MASNQWVAGQVVGMQISILKGSAVGTAVYVETQTPTSNVNGLVSIEIGTGSVVSGDFTTIVWSNDAYFIKTETDPAGGASYTISGTSQLLSVPYALNAKNGVALGANAGDMLYWDGTAWVVLAATTNTDATLQMILGVPTWVGGFIQGDGDVTTATGKTWGDRNLGATQVAQELENGTSVGTPAQGYWYQWGRTADGHELPSPGTTAVLSTTDTPGHANFITDGLDWRSPSNDNLWQGISGINNPCPALFRLPTEAEFRAEIATWDLTGSGGEGGFASPLKLTFTGVHWMTDATHSLGDRGYYWTSTIGASAGKSIAVAISLNAYLDGDTHEFQRAFGMAVRCIKD